jgi:hypothetical protein
LALARRTGGKIAACSTRKKLPGAMLNATTSLRSARTVFTRWRKKGAIGLIDRASSIWLLAHSSKGDSGLVLHFRLA